MDIRVFLAHVVQLELEAEEAYLKLVELMTARDNSDAAAFFGEMAGFCRLHREAAMRDFGFDDEIDIAEVMAAWQEGGGETPRPQDAGSPLDLDGAMALALAAERRGVAFYEQVAQTATNPQTRVLAEEFVAEEREHVQKLERFAGLRSY